mmetsp:Transcript_5244/g.16044  ORF Transcript_5244/g.16044 Transcript_5244/m.16044 type:complete len:81 (-) Transcript_5244:2333-2575(-)
MLSGSSAPLRGQSAPQRGPWRHLTAYFFFLASSPCAARPSPAAGATLQPVCRARNEQWEWAEERSQLEGRPVRTCADVEM